MSTTSLHATDTNHATSHTVPTTPRGRALYTVDWFLNGKPVLQHHDHPRMTLRRGFNC